MDNRLGMSLLLLSFLSTVLSSSQHQNNQTTANYQLSRKPCQVKGQEGTCMFVWECVKTEGTPLGMCMERFMFGSCCAHDLDNNVVPKPSMMVSSATTTAGLAAINQPSTVLSLSSTEGSAGPTTSILTTLITSRPPTISPWRENSTSETMTVVSSTQTVTSHQTYGSSSEQGISSTVFFQHNDSTMTSTPSPTTSPTHNNVTSSSSITTTTTVSTTTQPSTTTSTQAVNKPTGSHSTFGPIKLRPKPYRRTTTRRAAIPTTTNFPLINVPTEALNETSASSLAPLIAPTSINSVLTPNTLINTAISMEAPFVAVNIQPLVVPSTVIHQLSTTLTPDSLAGLNVPITTESQHSMTLTLPIDLSSSLAFLNEINTTADKVSVATDKPYHDPSFHAHVTTGDTWTAPETQSTTSSEQISTSQSTVATTSTTASTVVLSSVTSLNSSKVNATISSSVSSAVQNVTSTTPVPSQKPSSIVTLINNKNTSGTESTKKPVLAVTSLPSSYPNVECGVPPLINRQEGRIVGGSNSKFGSWPWQISVRRTSFFGFSSTHRCGGALLNELWVVTAGHCVEDLLVSQIRLRMGEFDFSSVQEPYPFVERGVNKKIVHPKYNFFTYEYDLALVRLEEPITFQPNIAPICLPATDESLIGQNGTVTGWGRLSEGGTLPSMLQQVTVPIVSNDKCKDMFLKAGRHEYIPDIFMCAGFEEGGRDSCQGDSGGPLQIRGRDGRYFLAGIISWGIGCAEANLPGVCTRISKFTPWILENVT